MVFEGLNGTLCEVAAMASCGRELEVNDFRGHEFLQFSITFIFKEVEKWFEAVVFYDINYLLVDT